MHTMRLLNDAALPAAANMARDDTLVRSVAAGGPATLRFYQWRPAAISLGYFQPIELYDQQAEALTEFDLVRRATGGGAILHHTELTYSLAVPGDWPIIAHRPTVLYELAHQAIAEALQSLGVPVAFFAGECEGNAQRGPFFCFARRHRYDLVAEGRKMVGSAQRRRAGAILQHGSIVLKAVAPQPCAGVNDHRAQPVSPDQLAAAVALRMERALEVALSPGPWGEQELAAATAAADAFASEAWTRQR